MEFKPLIELILRNKKFILTAHETPDGDALGAEFAMLRALQKLGKQVKVFNADPAPEKFSFIDRHGEITLLREKSQVPRDIEEYILFILDVNDINNIGPVSTMILPWTKEYFIIDHHEGDVDTLGGNLIQKSASSTCELLYQLFRKMGVEIDLAMAQSLYTGIVFDTGSFIYPKTTALTFEIARDLVTIGVNPNYVYSNLYESNSIPSLLLLSRVLGTLKLWYHDHVAVQTLTADMIRESEAKYEEADQIINIPLRSRDILVSIFFKENLEGIRRCSLRSKGNIDVATIAKKYGGGGHKTAAGFKCHQGFPETLTEILEMLKAYFPEESK